MKFGAFDRVNPPCLHLEAFLILCSRSKINFVQSTCGYITEYIQRTQRAFSQNSVIQNSKPKGQVRWPMDYGSNGPSEGQMMWQMPPEMPRNMPRGLFTRYYVWVMCPFCLCGILGTMTSVKQKDPLDFQLSVTCSLHNLPCVIRLMSPKTKAHEPT